MPLYDVEHVIPLTDEEQELLAKEFTRLHALRFQTPFYFVNVRFTDASNQKVFRGGVAKFYNRLILRTRAGSSRPDEIYHAHMQDLVHAWTTIIGDEGVRALRTVWVMGALTTALEDGLIRPKAGEEKAWLRANMQEFFTRAKNGDEEMRALTIELGTREDFADVAPQGTQITNTANSGLVNDGKLWMC